MPSSRTETNAGSSSECGTDDRPPPPLNSSFAGIWSTSAYARKNPKWSHLPWMTRFTGIRFAWKSWSPFTPRKSNIPRRITITFPILSFLIQVLCIFEHPIRSSLSSLFTVSYVRFTSQVATCLSNSTPLPRVMLNLNIKDSILGTQH